MPSKYIKSGAVRVTSFEVTKLDKDAYRRWLALSDDARGVVNCVWQTWLVWHVKNGSAEKLKRHFAADKAWRDGGKQGDRPKWPVQQISKECAKAIYDACAATFPNIATDSRELLRNSTQQKIASLKAAKGNMPGWVAILFCNQSLPSTIRGNPIPFSKKNAVIEPPAEAESNWKINLRISRVPVEGKKAGTTILETVQLWTKGRKCASQLAILKRIAAGEYDFCGSSLVYCESKRKWFAKIAYRMPAQEPAAVDENKVAFLRPSPTWPWKLRLPGRNRRPGGPGGHVASVRRQLLMQRWSRQSNYRVSGSSNKGHGLNRALRPIWQLSQRWKDFVKTTNYTVAKDVVQQCIEAGCGTLVYFQPTVNRDSRFLATTGKIPGREDSTGWDWFQVGKRLGDLCQQAGVKLVVRKSDESREVERAEAGKAVASAAARKPKRIA